MATLKIADRKSDAAKFLENWKRQNGIPSDSKALPPVESVPPWMRGYIFPKAKKPSKNELLISQLYRLKGEGNTEHLGSLFKNREQGPATLGEYNYKLKIKELLNKQ